jgi:hypothetical protein
MEVTVIVPAYNVERFLSQAVESIIATSYPDLKVLVVEDGSMNKKRNRSWCRGPYGEERALLGCVLECRQMPYAPDAQAHA